MNNITSKIPAFHFQRVKKISLSEGIRRELYPYVERNGFNVEAMSPVVHTGTVSCHGRTIVGFCMRNRNGGYYFFSEDYMDRPVFLVKEGSVVVPAHPRQTSRTCLLFWDMYDCMSYRTLRHLGLLPSGVPLASDCIVIGSFSNYVSAMLDSECYERSYMLLPNTCYGRTMALTMVSPGPVRCRNKHNCIDLSGIYQGHRSLYAYMRSVQGVEPIQPQAL